MLDVVNGVILGSWVIDYLEGGWNFMQSFLMNSHAWTHQTEWFHKEEKKNHTFMHIDVMYI